MDYMDYMINGSRDTVEKLLKTNLSENDKKAAFKTAVEIINLETSYQCNRKCDYCPVSDSTRRTHQSTMSLSLVHKIASQLSEIRYENRISLNLYNEPLLDDNLEEKIETLRRHLPWATLSLNSNGDKLRRDRLEKLSKAGLNFICVTLHPQPFSIDTPSMLSKRIKKLLEKNSDGDDVKFDLKDGFCVLNTAGIKLKIQWPNWRLTGTDRGGQIENYNGGKILRTLPCVKPFREFTIFYDGDVQPCCESFHDEDLQLVKIGNLNHTTIFDAYASKNLAQFRRSVFGFGKKAGICKYCSSADYSNTKDSAIRDEILKETA